MSSLLTLNGVPPQIIGSLTPEQRANAVACSQENGRWDFFSKGCRNFLSDPDGKPLLSHMGPFAGYAFNMAERFMRWGAESWSYVSNDPHDFNRHDVLSSIGLISSQIDVGQSTFNGQDLKPHSDFGNAVESLYASRKLGVRLLCVSSNPAEFVDITGSPSQRKARKILNQHREPSRLYKGRFEESRFYNPSLIEWAQANQCIVKPAPWDVIAFDFLTPHRPTLAPDPHRRIFQQAWLFFHLPYGWEKRVARGDVPRWGPV